VKGHRENKFNTIRYDGFNTCLRIDTLYHHQEKVSTCDVKIKRNKVWVNPNAYPEGTAKPGAIIITNRKNEK
jgi:hypothetical protein